MDKRTWLRRRAVVGTVSAVVVLGIGGSAWALSASSPTSYRLASVTRGSVDQTLVTTGTITPVREADLDFQVAGTVAKVLKKDGQRVKAGQRVALLDRSSLRSSLRAARSTLSDARASLVSDEDSQSSAASASSSTSTTPTPTASASASPKSTQSLSPTSGTGSTGSGSGGTVSKQLLAKLQHDQSRVLSGQQQLDSDLMTAKAALKAAKIACTAKESGSSGSTSTTTTTATTACVTATKASLADQEMVASDESGLATAESTLNRDLSSAIGSVTSPKTSSSSAPATDSADVTAITSVHLIADVTTSPSTDGTSTANPNTTSTNTTSTGTTVTAAKLAADQATIDSDRASVATAKADFAQATLRSPISGKVVATTVSEGDQVDGTSSSTSPAVKVVGSKQSKVTINVTATQVRTLKAGMAAQVTPDGASKALVGAIMSIGQAATDSTTGDTTYPVTITLTSRPTGLVLGADAQVSLVLSHLTGVLVVPTSAVHTSGTQAYVETDVAGKAARETVTVGAVGADVTQIKSGATAGQHVVLADLDAAVPSSSTNLLDNATDGGGFSGRTFSQTGGAGGGVSGPPPGATGQG